MYGFNREEKLLFDLSQGVCTCSKCLREVPAVQMALVPVESPWDVRGIIDGIPARTIADLLFRGVGQVGDTCRECAS